MFLLHWHAYLQLYTCFIHIISIFSILIEILENILNLKGTIPTKFANILGFCHLTWVLFTMMIINWSNSHLLDPSNISSLVYWMVIKGWDRNLVYEPSLHLVSSHGCGLTTCSPIFTPSLSVFALIQDIHISSTNL